MGEEQARVTLSARIGALRAQLRTEMEATAHPGWLASVVALIVAAPWIVFASDVPVAHVEETSTVVVLGAAFLIAQVAMHLLAICGPLCKVLAYRPTIVAGGVMFAAGIAAMFLTGRLLGPSSVQIAVLCAGAVLCGSGQVLLIAKWYPHFARTDSIVAFTVGWAGAVVAIIGFCIIAFMNAWVAMVLTVLVYAVVPIIAIVKVPDYVPKVQLWADSLQLSHRFRRGAGYRGSPSK